jgi:hypothetical protein
VKSVHLGFKGEERRLDSYRFSVGDKKRGSGGTLRLSIRERSKSKYDEAEM